MENGQPTKTKSEQELKVDISGDSPKLSNSEPMPLGVSPSSPSRTTATMLTASPKTYKNAELQALRLKIGLVAGALADFQSAGGMIVMDEVAYKKASGSENKAIKLLLFIRDADIVAERTPDGIDFDLVAEIAESESEK
jgi:hypothetical protein